MPSPIFLSATDQELPGDVPRGLARYVNVREIARGGGGCLSVGRDRVTGRDVAIKTLLPDTAHDREHRRRFLREARLTAQLEHPNTVPVYDVGEDEGVGPYFVMKRISGENLFQILVRIATGDAATATVFPVSRRLDIVADAAQALAYAHARGVIHRDVKPENIWVGNFGEVILLDWGVAKVWGHPDDNVPVRQSTVPTDAPEPTGRLTAAGGPLRTLTGGGTRPGTPLYMSPEQVRGDRSIDERSDVFAAGVCLYEAAVIREPFRGASIDDTFDRILHHPPVKPSEANPDADLPPGFDAVIERALAKSPGDRYPTMRDLIAAVRAL